MKRRERIMKNYAGKNKKRILAVLVLIAMLISLMIGVFTSQAANGVKQSGSMVLYIKDTNGVSSTVTIKVWKNATITASEFWDASSSWNVSVSGTNNHGIAINDSNGIITTSKDSAGNYRIFSIPIRFTNHAFYQYSNISYVKKNGNTDSLSASGLTGGMVDAATVRTMTIKVNGSQLGVCTRSGVWHTGTASATLTYTRPSYSVSFTDGLGTTLKTQSVLRGANATPPANPTRTGYIFDGWDKAYTGIKAATTVNAKWKAKEGNFSYHGNGGTGSMTGFVLSYGQSQELAANEFQREGYQFMGWSLKPRGEVNYQAGDTINYDWDSSGDITLYAIWQKENSNFNLYDLEEDEDMFTGSESLVGGNGTTYDSEQIDSAYAHRDTEDYPGYFTEK